MPTGNVSRKDDFKIIWICDECRTIFLYHDDSEIHCQRTDHSHLSAFDSETGRLLRNKGISLAQ